MTSPLKAPAEYLGCLERLRVGKPYARRWRLRIDRLVNKHPECGGAPWGWYEVWPLGVVVGYWGSRKDDLDGVDIQAWNAEAAEVSRAGRI